MKFNYPTIWDKTHLENFYVWFCCSLARKATRLKASPSLLIPPSLRLVKPTTLSLSTRLATIGLWNVLTVNVAFYKLYYEFLSSQEVLGLILFFSILIPFHTTPGRCQAKVPIVKTIRIIIRLGINIKVYNNLIHKLWHYNIIQINSRIKINIVCY